MTQSARGLRVREGGDKSGDTYLERHWWSATRQAVSGQGFWTAAEREDRGVPRPTHVSVCWQEILPDDQVIPSLFEDTRQIALDRAVDGVNDRWGRGTVMAVAAMAAMAAKAALDHGRIPFGRPSESWV